MGILTFTVGWWAKASPTLQKSSSQLWPAVFQHSAVCLGMLAGKQGLQGRLGWLVLLEQHLGP